MDELIWCEWWRRERFVRGETQLIVRAMKRAQDTHARPVSKKELLLDLVKKVAAKAVEGGEQQTTNGEGVKPLAQQQAEEGETQIWPAFTAAYMGRDLLGPIQRYATMYGHRYYRALLLLLRLQATRRVQKVAPPVAVDISLSNSESSKEVI
ncbi:MAG TPA: hypothetical protein VGY99_00445 [Candidatus Binataceae bacterium]|nr:hypothetical protein [Candidatus Binataceae bacterium]